MKLDLYDDQVKYHERRRHNLITIRGDKLRIKVPKNSKFKR